MFGIHSGNMKNKQMHRSRGTILNNHKLNITEFVLFYILMSINAKKVKNT